MIEANADPLVPNAYAREITLLEYPSRNEMEPHHEYKKSTD